MRTIFIRISWLCVISPASVGHEVGDDEEQDKYQWIENPIKYYDIKILIFYQNQWIENPIKYFDIKILIFHQNIYGLRLELRELYHWKIIKIEGKGTSMWFSSQSV